MTADGSHWRAVSRPLPADAPALEDIAGAEGYLFVRDGVGLAGTGVAARVPRTAIARFLAEMHHDDPAGIAWLAAFGAVPFLPGADCDFVVPEVVVGRDAGGRCWTTTVTPAGEGPSPSAAPRPARAPLAHAQRFTVAPRTPVAQYLSAVAAARDAVRAGSLAKAVIAREVEVTSDEPIDVHAVLLRLRATFGSSYRYSVDGLVGASPELLVAVDGSTVRSHPLAGTAPRTGDPDTDHALAEALVASTKDQIEHRVVIDMIYDTLLPWCSFLDWQPEPSIVTVANVQHLGTAMEGHLSEPRPHVLDLVAALCPTPALGGSPRADALDLIARVEGFARGRYGGAVGWVDAAGNGTFAVTIRCAELSADRTRARLVAGGGIVAGSDPLHELAETQAKLQAMLSAVVRP